MKNKEDRRIRITKMLIKDSLIELMQRHSISQVTVKMICETADINRSTFYSHYNDLYDLLNQIQDEAIMGIKKNIMHTSFMNDKHEIIVPSLIEVLKYAKANRSMFLILFSESNIANFQNGLMFLAREKALQENVKETGITEKNSNYLEIFVISGIISLMKEWLHTGCSDEPHELAVFISKLLFEGISSLYVPKI